VTSDWFQIQKGGRHQTGLHSVVVHVQNSSKGSSEQKLCLAGFNGGIVIGVRIPTNLTCAHSIILLAGTAEKLQKL